MRSIALCIALAVLLPYGTGCGDGNRGPTTPPAETPSVEDEVRAAFVDTALAEAVLVALSQTPVPLDSLTQLTARGRGITALTGIERLSLLQTLDLADNQIRDLAPLADLDSLVFLDLANNRIEEITALAEVFSLQSLSLSFNAVQDLSPLLGLDSLKTLELVGNPLDDRSLTEYLPALGAEGVQVVLATGPDEPGEVVPELPDLRFAFPARPRYRLNIFIARTDGSPPVNLLAETADFSGPDWSPDGSRLAFASNREDPLGTAWHIYATNADGSDLRRLTAEGRAWRGPRWSPDGAMIAFSMSYGYFDADGQKQDLYLMDADGANAHRLTHAGARDGQYSWSPEGRRILFRRTKGDPWDAGYTEGIFVLDLERGEPFQVAGDPGVSYSSLSWSPDGTRILCESWSERNSEILVLDADGGSQIYLTSDSAQEWSPVWSPDGTEILFCSDREHVGGDFFAMSADGTDLRRLSGELLHDLHQSSPSWSPDRSLVAFTSDKDGPPAIYVWDRESGYVANLTGDLEIDFPDVPIAWAPR